MGAWGYYQHPLEPPDRSVWDELMAEADQESLEEFIEQEMSYADAMAD